MRSHGTLFKTSTQGFKWYGGLYWPCDLQYTPINVAFNNIQTVQNPLIYRFHEIKKIDKINLRCMSSE